MAVRLRISARRSSSSDKVNVEELAKPVDLRFEARFDGAGIMGATLAEDGEKNEKIDDFDSFDSS